MSELTHAYQHLAAQAALDRQWAGRVEMAITDHALWLYKHKAAGNHVAARFDGLTDHLAKGASGATTKNTTGATAGANNDGTTDATDAALRAHVQAQDAAMGARRRLSCAR